MKFPLLLITAITGMPFIISCNSGSNDDAKQKADSTNTANIDTAKMRDTSQTHPVHMADLKPDADFAVAATDGGMLEVALGKMAEQKGMTSEVKKLGAQMVKDHSKANMELKALSMEKHIAIPSEMSAKCQKEVSDLEEKKGRDFDRAYVDLMVKDHKVDIEDFKKEANSGNDAQMSEWAKKTLPILEHHLNMSEESQKYLNKRYTYTN